MDLFWLEPICFFKIFSITVVKLVAVNSVGVFKSLAIDIDVLFNVSSKPNDAAGIKPRIPVNERLALERAKQHTTDLPISYDVVN